MYIPTPPTNCSASVQKTGNNPLKCSLFAFYVWVKQRTSAFVSMGSRSTSSAWALRERAFSKTRINSVVGSSKAVRLRLRKSRLNHASAPPISGRQRFWRLPTAFRALASGGAACCQCCRFAAASRALTSRVAACCRHWCCLAWARARPCSLSSLAERECVVWNAAPSRVFSLQRTLGCHVA